MSARLRGLARSALGRLRGLSWRAGRLRGESPQPAKVLEGVARPDDLVRILGDALHGLAVRDGRIEPLASGAGPLSRAQLSCALDDLSWYLQDLFVPFQPGPASPERVEVSLEKGEGTLELPDDFAGIQRIRLRNPGPGILGPFSWVFDGDDLSELPSLASAATAGARSAEGKAHAICRFVRERRYHGPPPTRSRDDPEAADPVSFFNGYGYGLCGNAANLMGVLCAAEGLEARVVNLRGHTLVEVAIDGHWHCFDPDAGTAYVDPARGTLPLSLAQVARRAPELVAPLHLDEAWGDRRELLAELLSNRDRHQVVATGRQLLESLGDGGNRFQETLRPGESLELHYHSTGPWRPAERLLPAPYSPPRELAHARSLWDLTAPGALACAEARGVTAGPAGLQVEAGACITLEPGLAGPLLDAGLHFGSAEALASAAPSLEAFDRGAWRPVAFEEGPPGPELGLRTPLVRCDGRRARVHFTRATTLPKLALRVLGQRARRGLPRLGPGNGSVQLRGHGPVGGPAQMILEFGRGAAGGVPEPLAPVTGAEVRLEDLHELRFRADADTEYDIQVSADPGFESPLASNLDRRVRGGTLPIGEAERAFLPAGEIHWRVRRAEQPGLRAGPFSEPACFRVPVASLYVRNVNRVLDSGQGHWTLGARRIDARWFEESGEATARWLIGQGMEPGSRCVEYGCGSLRVGRFLIDHLAPGHYAGLDLSARFYEEALATLDPEWLARRRPRFAVISPEAVEGFSAEQPDFVVSTSVVMHIPEPELPGYFENLARLVSPDGLVLVSFKQAPEFRQTSAMTWAYTGPALLEAARERGLVGEVLDAPELEESAGYETGTRLSMLRLRPAG